MCALLRIILSPEDAKTIESACRTPCIVAWMVPARKGPQPPDLMCPGVAVHGPWNRLSPLQCDPPQQRGTGRR